MFIMTGQNRVAFTLLQTQRRENFTTLEGINNGSIKSERRVSYLHALGQAISRSHTPTSSHCLPSIDRKCQSASAGQAAQSAREHPNRLPPENSISSKRRLDGGKSQLHSLVRGEIRFLIPLLVILLGSPLEAQAGVVRVHDGGALVQ